MDQKHADNLLRSIKRALDEAVATTNERDVLRTRVYELLATEPAKQPDCGLQWFPNYGHEPTIPVGWELVKARLADGQTIPEYYAKNWSLTSEILNNTGRAIKEYAIRRKPEAPPQSTPFPPMEQLHGAKPQLSLDETLQQLQIEAERLKQPGLLLAKVAPGADPVIRAGVEIAQRRLPALHSTDVVKPDILPRESIQFGWGFSLVTHEVNERWTSTRYHGDAERGSPINTKNGSIELYSSRQLALRALRNWLEGLFAGQLEAVDKLLEK